MSAGQLELEHYLDALAALGGGVSALETVIATAKEVLFHRAAGFRVGGERLVAGAGGRFDAASLTKPWMATLALALDAGGVVPLATRIGDLAPTAHGKLQARTLEDLLRHRAGLPAWAPLTLRLAKNLGDRDSVREYLLAASREAAAVADSEPGSAAVYSDLGYLLWGLLVEDLSGLRLAALLDERVCAPMGLAPVGALAAEPPLAVECRLDNGREIELAAGQGMRLARQGSFHLGRAQDGNARALGFLTGHAGLFLTADELLALGREWLRPGRLLDTAGVERALAGEGPYALGWARWSADGSAGPALSRSSFGHSGFTGGSLWIDPARERILILLAHRLSSAIDFNPVRREFHRLASSTFG